MVCFVSGAVSWQSRLQKCIALSTTEAGYIAITKACKELLWIKKFFHELGIWQVSYMLLYDSQSAIHLSKYPTFHSRSKYIEIRDVLEKIELLLEKVHTSENGSNMLTKSLPLLKLEVCRDKVDFVEGST